MRLPNFIGGSCPEFSPNAAAERTKNLYPHLIGGGVGKNTAVLYRIPGLGPFATLGGTSTRGLFEINDRGFVVAGDQFYELTNDGSGWEPTVRGTVQEDSNPVTFASNGEGGQDLIFTSGFRGYRFDLSTDSFSEIADADFPQGSAVMCGFLDGYYWVLESGGIVHISDLEDGSSWDALDVAQVSQNADQVRAGISDHRQLWLFGRDNTSVWYNSGNSDFPFEPTQNIVSQGIAAPFSCARLDNTVIWLTRNEHGAGMVVRANGFTPVRVSTHAMEQIWSGYPTYEDAVAYVEQWQGHQFYHLYFPTAISAGDIEDRVTWTYDVTTGLWHERCLWDANTLTWLPDVGRCHMFFREMHLIGDRRIGAIYEERAGLYQDSLVTV